MVREWRPLPDPGPIVGCDSDVESIRSIVEHGHGGSLTNTGCAFMLIASELASLPDGIDLFGDVWHYDVCSSYILPGNRKRCQRRMQWVVKNVFDLSWVQLVNDNNWGVACLRQLQRLLVSDFSGEQHFKEFHSSLEEYLSLGGRWGSVEFTIDWLEQSLVVLHDQWSSGQHQLTASHGYLASLFLLFGDIVAPSCGTISSRKSSIAIDIAQHLMLSVSNKQRIFWFESFRIPHLLLRIASQIHELCSKSNRSEVLVGDSVSQELHGRWAVIPGSQFDDSIVRSHGGWNFVLYDSSEYSLQFLTDGDFVDISSDQLAFPFWDSLQHPSGFQRAICLWLLSCGVDVVADLSDLSRDVQNGNWYDLSEDSEVCAALVQESVVGFPRHLAWMLFLPSEDSSFSSAALVRLLYDHGFPRCATGELGQWELLLRWSSVSPLPLDRAMTLMADMSSDSLSTDLLHWVELFGLGVPVRPVHMQWFHQWIQDYGSLGISVEPLPVSNVYVSIIFAIRNDDYGGNMIQRFARTMFILSRQLLDMGSDAEVIIVEWNPPPLVERIGSILARVPGYSSVRIVTVPAELHWSLPHARSLPLPDPIAMNIGAQRARGDWILFTSMDCFLSPELWALVAQRRLSPDSFYTAPRVRVDLRHGFDHWDAASPDALDTFLKSHTAQAARNAHRQEENAPIVNISDPRIRQPLYSAHPGASDQCLGNQRDQNSTPQHKYPGDVFWGLGDFLLAERSLILQVGGYPQVSQIWDVDFALPCMLTKIGAQQVILGDPCLVYHQEHVHFTTVRGTHRWLLTDANFADFCWGNSSHLSEYLENNGYPGTPLPETIL